MLLLLALLSIKNLPMPVKTSAP